MTRKQIDGARELRLWIGQVIVPAVVGLATIDRLNPQLKYQAKDKVNSVKSKVTDKVKSFKKES